MSRKSPFSISQALHNAVIQELEELLAEARRGKIDGIAYVKKPSQGDMVVGAAGDLGRDSLRTTGALMTAVVAATQW